MDRSPLGRAATVGAVSAREGPFIDAPLVLVSQISRSGGSLLAQLFDGHPQVYAHPWEVRVWHPKKWDWPALDPDASADEWLEALSDPKWAKIAEEGFAKAGRNPFAKSERHPFTFSDETQRALFLELVASRPVTRSRDVLDCWFTSFFACWRDREPTGRELSITGFMPRVATSRESIERFAADYPDGALISILRDPRSWYASSRVVHFHKKESIGNAVEEWLEWGRRLEELIDTSPVPTLGVLFDDLVLEPEPTMRRVADFIGIEFDPILLRPTYAGRPVLPNSSFAVSDYGINPEMANSREISSDARAAIAEEALPLYRQLAERLRAGREGLAGRSRAS
jgi:Sulfotransferase family